MLGVTADRRHRSLPLAILEVRAEPLASRPCRMIRRITPSAKKMRNKNSPFLFNARL